MGGASYSQGGWFVLKIDKFIDILGNATNTATLYDYLNRYPFNWIQLYDLYSVFGDTGKENALESFIEGVRANCPGILRIGAIMGSGTAGFQSVFDYNASHSLKGRFNDFNKENEFWNYPNPGTETFTDWINSLNWLLAKRPAPLLPTDTISAYIANPGGGAWGTTEALQMVGVADYYECTNYVTDFTTERAVDWCMVFLGEAAVTLKTDQKTNLLVSAEPAFDGAAFASVGDIKVIWKRFFDDWFTRNYANRNRVVMNGINFFNYSEMQTYLP